MEERKNYGTKAGQEKADMSIGKYGVGKANLPQHSSPNPPSHRRREEGVCLFAAFVHKRFQNPLKHLQPHYLFMGLNLQNNLLLVNESEQI